MFSPFGRTIAMALLAKGYMDPAVIRNIRPDNRKEKAPKVEVKA